MTRVPVSPALFQWAQTRSGIPAADLTARFPMLAQWQSGEVQPTLSQLETFARATYTPIRFFLLEQPPAEPVPIPDLRSELARSSRPTANLLETIAICQRRQGWFREHASATGAAPVTMIGSMTPSLPPVEAGRAIRAALGFEVADRPSGWVDDSLRFLIDRMESVGVLVMRSRIAGNHPRRRLDPGEFRGFALADPLAPLAFVNAADVRAAQIFTLAHQLGHLCLGRSALDDRSAACEPEDAADQWCLAVAAEVLVPAAELRAVTKPGETLAEQLPRLDRHFRVGGIAVLRRLLHAGMLARRPFRLAYDREVERIPPRVGRPASDLHRPELSRVGRRFARALVTSTLEGNTPHRVAFRLLGVVRESGFTEIGRDLGIIT